MNPYPLLSRMFGENRITVLENCPLYGSVLVLIPNDLEICQVQAALEPIRPFTIFYEYIHQADLGWYIREFVNKEMERVREYHRQRRWYQRIGDWVKDMRRGAEKR